MSATLRARQLGLSLVEVMVAVVIGLIGILVITQAYVTSDNFNRSTLGEGGAQMNGLVALYSLERDTRMAGWGINNSGALGCGNIAWYYDPDYSASAGGSLPNITLAPVVITVDTVTPANPDQITVMYSSDGERMLPTTIASFNASSSEVSVDGTDGFSAGDLVLLVNGGGCTLGKITQVQTVAQKLQLNPGVSAPYNPPAWGSFPNSTYGSGDSILNLGNPTLRTFLIGNGKLRVSETLLSAGASTPTDLVDGIVDLRALYGKDTDDNNAVDTYNTTTPATSAAWLQVLSVKVGILARIGTYEKKSAGATECDATTAVPTWSGSTAAGQITVANPFRAISVASGSEDRCYRYRVFETTVPLRNMIWRLS